MCPLLHQLSPLLLLLLLVLKGADGTRAAAASCEEARAPLRTYTSSDGQNFEYNPCSKEWVLLESGPPSDQGTTTTPRLALPGRLFNYNFAAGEFQVNSLPLRVASPGSQRGSLAREDADTGLTIWDVRPPFPPSLPLSPRSLSFTVYLCV
jgi:hypothetical protein